MAVQTRIGISGWSYPSWKGAFYPKGLRAGDELYFVSQNMNSVELNGSFYALQSPKRYTRWYEHSAPGFLISVKGSRFVTHLSKSTGFETPLANFFASGIFELKEKLGPFLWQFPPGQQWEPGRFGEFLYMLPKNGREAAALAHKHDGNVQNTSLDIDTGIALRHAVEVRHESFRTNAFYDMLQKHNIALVMSDGGKKWPCFEEPRADFVYVRLHGNTQLYYSNYSIEELDEWATRIQRWQKERMVDVFFYFDNTALAHAPFNAMYLLNRVTGFRPANFVEEEITRHTAS